MSIEVLVGIWFLACYLIGNLDFGYILPKVIKGVDIRTVGSKNAGATNVWRTQGIGLAFWVFLGDLLKGIVCVVLSRSFGFSEWVTVGSGVAVVLGHDYPVFLKFRGGKGVATSVGVLLAFNPVCGLVLMAANLVVLLTTRIMSLASMTGITAAFVYSIVFGSMEEIALVGVLMLLIIWRHESNLERLAKGTESKLKFKKDEKR